MDRSTVAGMIDNIRNDKDFNVKDDKSLGMFVFRFTNFKRIKQFILKHFIIYVFFLHIFRSTTNSLCYLLHAFRPIIWLSWRSV